MILSIWLFENQFVNIVSISFTALVLNELLMVALEINTWHRLMIVSEIATLIIYVGSMVFLPTYFGMSNCFICFPLLLAILKNTDSDALLLFTIIRSGLYFDKDIRLEGGSDHNGQQFPIVLDQDVAEKVCTTKLLQVDRLEPVHPVPFAYCRTRKV